MVDDGQHSIEIHERDFSLDKKLGRKRKMKAVK